MKRTWYREKRYLCGDYIDTYIYPVYPVSSKRVRRGAKRKPTRAVQEKLNRRHAKEKYTRLIHANFTEKDLALTLTFGEDPASDREAVTRLQKYLRKLRSLYKKAGIELKYLWSMEKTKRGRVHFHLVLSGGLDRDLLEQLWPWGYSNSKRLQFEQGGLAALGAYMTKSHWSGDEPRGGYRSYNGSKNLVDPPPEVNDYRVGSRTRAKELAEREAGAWEKLYPGCELIELEPFISDEYGSVYIFARMRRVE